MKIGLFAFCTDYSMPINELAVAAEERGFDSIWLPEHTHIPASRLTPYPGGGELPLEYSHTFDPFVALGIAAGVTTTLKLATGICITTEHHALTLAKTVATLDHISNGRVLLGLGAGWNREEMENHGTVYDERFSKLEEQMQALKIIWTEEQATFQGKYESFDSVWSWPKPIQRPHPPLILGGDTDYTLQRIVNYGDGWLPIAIRPDRVEKGIIKLDELAVRAGRDPETISVSAYAPPPKEDVISKFRDLRVERTVLLIPPQDSSKTLARLDNYAKFIQ